MDSRILAVCTRLMSSQLNNPGPNGTSIPRRLVSRVINLWNYIFIPTARLFERIPIQDQAHNRKSFTPRVDTTGIWQRIPRQARDGEFKIHPESLQTKLNDNFIPPPAKKVARKTQHPDRSDSNPSMLVDGVLKTFVLGYRELQKPLLPRIDGGSR